MFLYKQQHGKKTCRKMRPIAILVFQELKRKQLPVFWHHSLFYSLLSYTLLINDLLKTKYTKINPKITNTKAVINLCLTKTLAQWIVQTFAARKGNSEKKERLKPREYHLPWSKIHPNRTKQSHLVSLGEAVSCRVCLSPPCCSDYTVNPH